MHESDYEKALMNISREYVEEIEEYEQKYSGSSRLRSRKRYPSNKDVLRAINALTSGYIHIGTLDELYKTVISYLDREGFDASMLSEERFYKIVSEFATKGWIKLIK